MMNRWQIYFINNHNNLVKVVSKQRQTDVKGTDSDVCCLQVCGASLTCSITFYAMQLTAMFQRGNKTE